MAQTCQKVLALPRGIEQIHWKEIQAACHGTFILWHAKTLSG